MKLEVGKTYLNSNGAKVKIVEEGFFCVFYDSSSVRYNGDGTVHDSHEAASLPEYNLIKEHKKKPKKISKKKFDKVVQSIFDKDDLRKIAWNTFDVLRNELFGDKE